MRYQKFCCNGGIEMCSILEKIRLFGIIPVIKIDNANDAVPLGKALIEGGLPVAEITFRTAAAENAIKNICYHHPSVLVGAGTVTSVEHVKRAIDAGAKFIVSPGFNPPVVDFCVSNNIAIIPGCSNPTDIELALQYGLDAVKFFPAEAFGGLATLKAMSAPYSMMRFVPTGGIGPENLNNYLSFEKVIACGGSWMVKDELIRAGRFDEITRLVREAVSLMLGFDIAHVGINAENDEESFEIANRFANIFNMPVKQGNTSNFAGTVIEACKGAGPGKNGHIAIKTNSIDRAVAYFDRIGVQVDMDTAKRFENGSIAAVYLKEEIGGFAVHLMQKK